jgi:Zn-dependent M28 family amino/carboxypeptidase
VRAAFALALALTAAGCGGAQASGAGQDAPAPPAFDGARAWAHLRRQVEFGPRPAGSDALVRTRRYILDELRSYGIDTREQAFTADTPAGPIEMANVIGTIPGRRQERLLLASHFDTKRAPFRFVGANDAASSTAALLELGRVLARRQGELTIELVFFDGEEAVNWDWGTTGVDNTYGSRYYVEAARKDGSLKTIGALVLLDMIADRDPQILRDGNSTPWLVDIIWSTAGRLGHGAVFSNQVTVVDDDHIAFLRAGVPAVDVIEHLEDYPQWHTAQDDLDHVSADTLKIVGDVILASLPAIEARLATPARR